MLHYIAQQLKAYRITANLTQEELSTKAQVPLGTLRRFEQTGEIGLSAFLRIVEILRLSAKLKETFTFTHQPSSLKELEKQLPKTRQRVRKSTNESE